MRSSCKSTRTSRPLASSTCTCCNPVNEKQKEIRSHSITARRHTHSHAVSHLLVGLTFFFAHIDRAHVRAASSNAARTAFAHRAEQTTNSQLTTTTINDVLCSHARTSYPSYSRRLLACQHTGQQCTQSSCTTTRTSRPSGACTCTCCNPVNEKQKKFALIQSLRGATHTVTLSRTCL